MSRQALDLVAPLRCACCSVPAGADLCAVCATRLVPLVPPICDRCGAALPRPAPACDACAGLEGVRRARSLVAYGRGSSPARALTLTLKRRGRPALAGHMGTLLADLAASCGLTAATVTFVPAGSRARGKGFDHAHLLARAVAARMGSACVPLLRRTGVRARQSDVPASERRANAEGAFVSRPVAGGVLLVDDVLTTGATAEACAVALLAAGAGHVDVLTWARTLRRQLS